jgi:hypothetical protein
MKKVLFTAALGALLSFTGQIVSQTGTLAAAQATAQQPAAKEFTGMVVKSGDTFSLTDEATKASYTLDDTQRAAQFEGKKVKVMGVLDAQTHTIHVQSIAAS